MQKLHELLTKENIDQKQCYSLLSSFKNNKELDEKLLKIWDLIGNNTLSKNIVYLSFLSNRNVDLLNKCILWDKKIHKFDINNPCALFDYTIYFEQHWFYKVINNANVFNLDKCKKTVNDKIAFIKLIKPINNVLNATVDTKWLQERSDNINIVELGEFWRFCIEEIKYFIQIVSFCLNYNNTKSSPELLHFIASHSILYVISEHFNLYIDCTEIKQFFKRISTNKKFLSENINDQLFTLTNYNIVSNLLKLVICEKEVKKSYVNEVINNTQRELLDIEPSNQIDLLEIIFATIFIKKSDIKANQTERENDNLPISFICNRKEVRLLLFVLKTVTDKVWLEKKYPQGTQAYKRLDQLRKNVTDALWRLELIESLPKCKKSVLYYMLAEGETLLNICLKCGDFSKAIEVLKVFNLTDTKLAQDVYYLNRLEELKDILNHISKKENRSGSNNYNKDITYAEAVEEFIKKYPVLVVDEDDCIIQENQNYPFLKYYLSKNNIFLDVLDLALTQTTTAAESNALIKLASTYYLSIDVTESSFLEFYKRLDLFYRQAGLENKLFVVNLLLAPQYLLDLRHYTSQEEFYGKLECLCTEFCASLDKDEEGVLNKQHKSHKAFLTISQQCCDYSSKGKYLEKLFKYLKAFSRVLYLEGDSSNLISNNKNTPFFKLLSYNRSELMGKLLFDQNLDPIKFERYFKKLKLDFLYHIAGNCFPTINLYVDENIHEDELYHENILYSPTKGVISYILKRNRLLALLLNEMYHVEGVDIDMSEIRIQNFLNFVRLPRVKHLKVAYRNSEILTALQNNISYKKIKEFVTEEINQNAMNSTMTNQSFEAAEEIFEGGVITIWKKLANILNSIPERQMFKEPRFVELRDDLLIMLINEGFECEYYQNIFHIKDREKRIKLLMNNMKNWPLEFCAKSIKHEISLFGAEESKVADELKWCLRHIENSKIVMDALGVLSWTNLYKTCTVNLVKVVRTLLFAQKVDVLIEFLELNDIDLDSLTCVNDNFLFKAFELGISLNSIRALLSALPKTHCVNVCKHLFQTLKSLEYLQFLANFLSIIAPSKWLNNILLSLKIMSMFSENENLSALFPLISEPLSIIEVLIMNTKLDLLGEVLKVIKPQILFRETDGEEVSVTAIDELLRRYAGKSLDFRVIPQLSNLLSSERIAQLSSSSDISYRGFAVPEVVPTKEQWVQNNEVTECMCCNSVSFSMFNRRHHCRRCGRLVCSSCSKKRMIVPHYEDILVRVCIDCYNEGNKGQVSSGDNKPWSNGGVFWILTNDSEHNRIVREEFSYEFAPSVSLCLSLMKYHTTNEQFSVFMFSQCEILLKLLFPRKEITIEIDFRLIILMIKHLAVAVRIAFQDMSQEILPVETILKKAAILELLAENNCLHLLPLSGGINLLSLRRVIDKLLEMEQWELALNVSAKAGFDNTGIFLTWGKSCLKAGCLMTAREKISKCINRNSQDFTYVELPTTQLKVTKNSPLLNDIIHILESKTEPIDEEVMDAHKLSGSTNTLNQSCSTSIFQPEGAMFVLNKIKKLKEIERGIYQKGNKVKSDSNKFGRVVLEPVIYQECIYYLKKYGNMISLVDFHLKYRLYGKILDYITNKNDACDIFIYVYMECLKEGNVSELHYDMSKMDSSLMIWQTFLKKLCYYLEKQMYMNSLYQLQQYMGDYIRAAMTCIRFYQQNVTTFFDLTVNMHFLRKSEQHLNEALEQEQWVDVSTVEVNESRMSFEEKSITNPLLIKKMTQQEIRKNAQIIKLQIDIAQFLANCERRGVVPMSILETVLNNLAEKSSETKLKVPTLFGSSYDKIQLGFLCTVCGDTVPEGFPLTLKIITDCNLKPTKVYNEVGKYLAQLEKYGSITELVSQIRKSCGTDHNVANEICDEMLLHVVATFAKNGRSDGGVEGFIRLITNTPMKISAYIETKQLKTAFFLATKNKRLMDIRRIMKEAEVQNLSSIRTLCQKALLKHANTSSTESDAN